MEEIEFLNLFETDQIEIFEKNDSSENFEIISNNVEETVYLGSPTQEYTIFVKNYSDLFDNQFFKNAILVSFKTVDKLYVNNTFKIFLEKFENFKKTPKNDLISYERMIYEITNLFIQNKSKLLFTDSEEQINKIIMKRKKKNNLDLNFNKQIELINERDLQNSINKINPVYFSRQLKQTIFNILKTKENIKDHGIALTVLETILKHTKLRKKTINEVDYDHFVYLLKIRLNCTCKTKNIEFIDYFKSDILYLLKEVSNIFEKIEKLEEYTKKKNSYKKKLVSNRNVKKRKREGEKEINTKRIKKT